jgi:hypothetical protein
MECSICGKPTTLLVGDTPVCEDCYEKAGSCCLEFGGEDLWQGREEQPEGDHPDLTGRTEKHEPV